MPTAYGRSSARMMLMWPARARRHWRKDTGAGPAAAESAEIRELKKRNHSLEQENEEILRRAAAYLSRDINPQ